MGYCTLLDLLDDDFGDGLVVELVADADGNHLFAGGRPVDHQTVFLFGRIGEWVAGSISFHSPPFTAYSAWSMMLRPSCAFQRTSSLLAGRRRGEIGNLRRRVVDQERIADEREPQRLIGRIAGRVGGGDAQHIFAIGECRGVPAEVSFLQLVLESCQAVSFSPRISSDRPACRRSHPMRASARPGGPWRSSWSATRTVRADAAAVLCWPMGGSVMEFEAGIASMGAGKR